MDNFYKQEAEKEVPEILEGKPFDAAKGKETVREAEPIQEETAREKIQKEIAEIEKIKLTPELKKEAVEEAVKIKELDNEGKVSRLLSLAKEKGLVFAVDVAKKIGDAYLLDSLHDSLIKEGRFREFEK
ncbi:MAG: hypothetical protein AAB451_02000 [Patescibacteria group bacterium]